MEDKVEFLLRAFDLKDQLRTGWVLREIIDPESVADHSWGTAVLCLVFGREAGIDVDRAIKISIVHDLAEAVTGDIARRVDAEAQTVDEAQKSRLETAAMDELGTMWDGKEIRALWQEYEDRASNEALFVRDMNLIDMCLQALKYEGAHRYPDKDPHPNFPGFSRLDEFFATSEPRISTHIGKRLFADIRARYGSLTDASSGDS
jgi:putative hydrolase of HD superfamily